MADILKRVQKLINQSKNNPSAEEAANAAAIAQELMFKYNIGEADLDFDKTEREVQAVVKESIEESVRRDVWKATLANSLARAFGCEMYTDHQGAEGRCRYQVFGLQSSVQTVGYLFGYLKLEIERLAGTEYRAHKSESRMSPRTWKNSFRMGAVNTIAKRLREKTAEQTNIVAQREAAEKKQAHAGTTALALYKSDQERVGDAWKAETKKLRFRTVTSRGRRHNPSAFDRGSKAANNLSLGGGTQLSGAKSRLEG